MPVCFEITFQKDIVHYSKIWVDCKNLQLLWNTVIQNVQQSLGPGIKLAYDSLDMMRTV